MRCGHCGKTFNLSQTIRKGKVTRVYYCRGYQTLRSAICTNKDRMNPLQNCQIGAKLELVTFDNLYPKSCEW